MILRFPSLDVLRLAVTSGAIPEAVRASATRFGFADDQSLWVEADVGDVVQKQLRRLGVQTPRKSNIDLAQAAEHWLQMFPLTHDPHAIDVGSKTPILFELMNAGQFAELATEILRLGNDRQSFRWLDDGDEAKALLRVIGPPYYSLLRAMDQHPTSRQATREPARLATPQAPASLAGLGIDEDAPIAYREVAPRVWVQVGYRHPLAEQLRAPEGQLVMLGPPHGWTHVPEGKLRDIYEVIDFPLPVGPVAWHDAELPAHINVPVRLTRSGAPEAAELWLLREDGIGQLEEMVRSSDNELLARLAFAVGEKDGARIVILRVRPSKSAPPVLVLDGLAFRSFLRIPNLFVPVGMALHPPLRREAVGKLLVADNTRIYWLTPNPDSRFIPESLPDDAFRPLSEWIDYVLEHEHQAIKTWIGATQFDFEGFICKDDPVKEKKPPKNPKPTEMPSASADDSARAEPRRQEKKPKLEVTVGEEAKAEPSELQRRLRELENAFNTLKTPLDDPDRQTIWRALAELNGALHQHADAASCWASALWEQPSVPVDWPRTWFRAEAKPVVGQALPTAQVMRIINLETPSHSSLRQLTAYLIWAAAAQPPHPQRDHVDDLRPHLGRVQQFVEEHEAFLGVRTAWLTWHAIFQLSGDVLTLVRARDRVLERLFLHGLTPELDLPGFLRFTGLQANSRFRMVRNQVVRLHRHVQDWAKTGTLPTPTTHAYIDLAFAFGLARLGETTEAVRLRDAAGAKLATADEIHSWLYAAFACRVQQALDGKPAVERLPVSLLEQLEALENPDYLQHVPDGKQRDDLKSALRNLRFKIDRMREKSRILEPLEERDAYDRWRGSRNNDLTRELTALADLTDRAELTQRLQKLLDGKQKFKGTTNPAGRILVAALQFAPRLGQSFGEKVLDRVPGQLAKTKDAEEQAALLEKSVLLAAHYDRKEDVSRYIVQIEAMLQGAKMLRFEKLIPLVAGSFRSLRKFGLRDLVTQLMQRLGTVIAAEERSADRVRLMLELAAGWYFFGAEDKARTILDEARDLLFRKELDKVQQTELACAYVTALGQAPRLMEFYRKAQGIYDLYQTTSHFSLSRYRVVEATVLALVSDDFTLDRESRKRLDDDEYLVRRRIHADVRAALAKATECPRFFV